ncbi:hypothetical protein G6F59_013316 [Rhizopus arrhizus]|nr:hypothetical protein G6F59_013316 [Rhizopus arrhizus]
MNSLGTTLAPLFGGLLILSAKPRSEDELALLPQAEALAYRAAEAQSVQLPYFGLAVALFLLAVAIWMFRLPTIPGVEGRASSEGRVWDVLRHRHVRLGVLAIFCYVGAEVSIGSVLVNFLSSPGIGQGLTEQEATGYVSLYWGGALAGRLVGAALLARLDARHLLGLFAVAVMILLGITVTASGGLAKWAVVSIGLFNSIMFPTIFALSIERLGPLTNKGSSLLIMAIVGGAVVPYLQGVLADHIGVQASFILPLLCYGYIIFYGLVGAPQPPASADTPRAFLQYAGGAPANVAVAAARLGAKTQFVGMLGRDMFGDFLADSLVEHGVGTDYIVRTDAAKTALAFVALDASGERSFSFYRPPAADLLFRDT